MNLLESDIENFIFKDLTENGGDEVEARGLQLSSHYHRDQARARWYRQLNLDPYGIADIVGFYRLYGEIHCDIIELKAVPIECDHFDQVCRYNHAVKVYLRNTFRGPVDIRTHCYLAGTGFTSGHYIQNYSLIKVAEISYDITGINFEMHHGSWCRGADEHNKSFRIKHNGQKVH